ncbi:DUF4232 domain-containing protein [Streptomyces thermodiastaticus]|jgi:hypothetical protein|uniref:DUF4232 domain-containing protein n=1 Tax=Streptomyces thermodiastaticus TaxID=44061 RepID=UPI00167B1D5B|nr:DUF4232 domain-containing protein [Streptomyces thermodiastaticus]MCE7551362.1 DUF4232 domain-containing protein [Streptomyces thermodiastaticus]GHF93592.1 lipoprotein [Streptomyces thermodiastaticus]
MAYTFPSRHRTAALASAGALAVLGLLSACGNGGDTVSAPQKVPGAAAPATGDATNGDTSPGAPPGTSTPAGDTTAASDGSNGSAPSAHTSGTRAATRGTSASSTRCHTSELRATVGPNDPGAGQENFPVVLTNVSGRTCTVRGYPGAAFVDASGKQLGPDPKRSPGSPSTVTLEPHESAWAGLSFANPQVSEARAATPATLVVTPPDERDPLRVRWTAGPVPVGGNASSVYVTVLRPGTGP